MAFERVAITIKPASIGTGVKCRLTKGVNKPAMMTISLAGQAMRQCGWGKDDRGEVAVGTQDDHGMIRLRKNNSVKDGATVNLMELDKGNYLRLSLGHLPMFVDRKESAQWCKWEMVEDGWMEIVLPKWADETAPNRKARPESDLVKIPLRTQAVNPTVKKEVVTGQLMGDPPAGRREMMEKMGNIKP